MDIAPTVSKLLQHEGSHGYGAAKGWRVPLIWRPHIADLAQGNVKVLISANQDAIAAGNCDPPPYHLFIGR